jgi:RNase P subunit RPR2
MERLGRQIEEIRAIPGHRLRCSECHRLSSGRATGWTMYLGDDEYLSVFCPECEEIAFG